jgi:hypothetical protein
MQSHISLKGWKILTVCDVRFTISRALCVCTPSLLMCKKKSWNNHASFDIVHTKNRTTKILSFSTDGVKFISWPDFLFYRQHYMRWVKRKRRRIKHVPMIFVFTSQARLMMRRDEIGVNKKKVFVCKRR